MGIYLAINICGVLITIFFVKNVQTEGDRKEKKLTIVKDIFRFMKNGNLLCIVTIVGVNGSCNSLFSAVFTNVSRGIIKGYEHYVTLNWMCFNYKF